MEQGKVMSIETTPKTAKQVSYKQLGSSGLKRYSGYVHEEFMPNLRWPWAGNIYKEMASNDATIGAVLYMAEMLIRGTKWTVKPASSSKEDEEAAKFVESCMNDMDTTWANTICEVLSMMTYGFSFHEIVYKIRRGPFETNKKYLSKYSDGRIGWRRLPIRSQDSLLEWEFDEEGDVSAFIQQAEPDYKVIRIPMSRGLLFKTTSSRGNPEGKSLLRNAYRSWYFKKHFEEIEGIGIERDLAGFPVLTAPDGLDLWAEDDERMVALRTRAEELVANVRRDSEEGILLPHGWTLDLLASSSSRQIDIGATIDRYDKRIAMTMLSDILLLGDKSGSFALADAKQSALVAALQAMLLNVADVFNGKAIPDLIYLNNFKNLTGIPKLEPGQLQTPSLKEVALMLRAWGIDATKDYDLNNHLRMLLGFPTVTKEDFDKASAKEANDARNILNKDPGQSTTTTRDDTAERDFEQNDQAYTGADDMSKRRFATKYAEVNAWHPGYDSVIPSDFQEALLDGTIVDNNDGTYAIATLEGVMQTTKGDYIIRGLLGEYYPCREAAFKEKYEELKNERI